MLHFYAELAKANALNNFVITFVNHSELTVALATSFIGSPRIYSGAAGRALLTEINIIPAATIASTAPMMNAACAPKA